MTGELLLGVLGLLGTVLGIPGIILWFLNRKNANTKLTLEADALSLAKFNALLQGYERRLAATEEENKELKATSDLQNKAIKDLQDKDAEKQKILEITNTRLERVRAIFVAYVNRVGIPMTAEESRVFEETIPLRPRMSRRSYSPPTPL